MTSLPPKLDGRQRFQNIFFKYFSEKTIKNLKLPRKYVNDNGDELTNPVYLKFRGREWEMKLKRYKDRVCFGKGWKEFSQSYSFEYNDLLIFGYEGNSTFQVSLFDRPQKLIEADKDDFQPSPLPHNGTRTSSSGGEAEVQEEAPSLEISHMKTKATHIYRSELKRKRDLQAENAEFDLKSGKRIKNSEMIRKQDFSQKNTTVGKSNTQSSQRTSEAMQRANASKPEYPSFSIKVLHTDTHGRILRLPFEFMRTYLGNASGQATLQLSDGRIWHVELKCENSRAEMQYGWWEFMQDCHLKVGDSCTFMLIDNARLLFEVVIFHKDQTEKQNFSQKNTTVGKSNTQSSQRTSEAMQRANASKPEYPSFSIKVLHTDIHGMILRLPVEFMRTYLGNASGQATLQLSDGRIWHVELKCENSRAEMQYGWWEFMEDSHLKVGDVCTFMLIDNARLLFEVVIFHKDQTDNHEDNDREDSNGNDQDNDNDAADDKPSFKKVMRPSYINRDRLWLPSEFSQTHLTLGTTYARLCVSGGETTWYVKLNYAGATAKLVSGWSKFVQDNDLKVGHVCKFLLIDSDRVSFEVVIEAGTTLSPDNDDDDENEDPDWVEPSFAPRPHKRKRTGCNVPTETYINIRDASGSSCTQQFLQQRPIVSRTKHQVREMRNDALCRAKAFRSGNPFCMVAMSHTYVHGRVLYFPSGFAKEHLNKQPSEVHLVSRCGSNERTWSVKFHNGRRASFRVGWLEFVQDNNLKVGDVCVFELIERSKFSFDVHFFRTT